MWVSRAGARHRPHSHARPWLQQVPEQVTPRKGADSPFVPATRAATAQTWAGGEQAAACGDWSVHLRQRRDWQRLETKGKRRGGGALLELIGAAGRRDTEAGLWRGCESPPRLRHEQKPGRGSCLTCSRGGVAPALSLSCRRLNPSVSDSTLGASPGTPRFVSHGVPPSLIYRPACFVIRLVAICP